jgi:hypothetical protein
MSKCWPDTGRSISRGSHVKWRGTGRNTKTIAVIENSRVVLDLNC